MHSTQGPFTDYISRRKSSMHSQGSSDRFWLPWVAKAHQQALILVPRDQILPNLKLSLMEWLRSSSSILIVLNLQTRLQFVHFLRRKLILDHRRVKRIAENRPILVSKTPAPPYFSMSKEPSLCLPTEFRFCGIARRGRECCLETRSSAWYSFFFTFAYKFFLR